MNYIARGYVSLSEEYHRSRSPALSLRVRESFFPPSFFFRPLSLPPGPPYSRRARLSMENHSCQWSPAHVTSRILYVEISVRSSSSICRDSFSFFSPLLRLFFFFSLRSRVQLVVRNYFCQLSFLDNVFFKYYYILLITYHQFQTRYTQTYPWSRLKSSSDVCPYIFSFSLFSFEFYIFFPFFCYRKFF